MAFELTAVITHTFLRDFDDRRPAPWSRNPSEYPIKMKPGEISNLLNGFRYEPWNLGRVPRDQMADSTVADQLRHIGQELVACLPLLPGLLTPQVMVDAIHAGGEDAWCEKRWLEDYIERL
jgi:hypothetical protein